MLPFEFTEQFLDVAPGLIHGDRRRHADIEEQVGFFRSATGAPRVSATDSSQIDDRFLSSVCGLALPLGNPFHDWLHQRMHPANGVHLFTTLTKSRVHVDPSTGDAYPHGAKVF